MSLDIELLTPAVVAMLRENLGLSPGEKLLVLTDVPAADELAGRDYEELKDVLDRVVLARATARVAETAFPSSPVTFLPYPSVRQSGTEVPREVAEAMRTAQVVVAMTTYSLTHTEGTAGAARTGSRVASMPGITADMFKPGGPMAADYAVVRKETGALADLLTRAVEVRVTCPAGTELAFSLEGRKGNADDGDLTKPGRVGNLPAGEAYAAPVEGTARGRLVVRKGWYPGLDEDLTLLFEAGYVTEVHGGGKVGRSLAKTLGLAGDGGQAGRASTEPELMARRNCAELGVGTNPNARTPDNVLEAEKIKGTIHVAIGDSSHMGGRTVADLHLDFVVPEPDLYLDGKAVMRLGRS